VKAVFISNIPSPYQIKLSEELSKYMDVSFWFLTTIEESHSKRPNYWEMILPKTCRLIPSIFKKRELFYAQSLGKELDSFNPDIVWLGGSWTMIAFHQGFHWARKNKKKIVFGPCEPSKQNQKLINKIGKGVLFKRKLKYADLILNVGYRSLDSNTVINSAEKGKIFTYAADLKDKLKQPLRKCIKGQVRFLYSGSLSKRFRIEDMLQVFENLRRSEENVSLTISGFGLEREWLEERVKNSELLKHSVNWRDATSWNDISTIYSENHVLVNFAEYSGWGLVVPEAMASGMGIIAARNIEAARHLVINRVNGFLVEDKDSLLEAMKKYVRTPHLVYEHGLINKKIAAFESIEFKALELSRLFNNLWR